MALTVTKSPELTIPAKNQCDIEVTTDNLVTSAGSAAEAIIQFPTSPTTGNFVFGNDLKSQTFTFVVSPDGSGIQLPRNTGSVDSTTYAAILITALLNNYYIYRDYTITVHSTSVSTFMLKFTAKQQGAEYSISSSGTIASYSLVSNTAGTSKQVRENFKVLIDVFAEKAGTPGEYENVYAGEGSPASNNVTAFDLQPILEAITSYSVPEFTSGPFFIPNGPRKFYLKFMEAFGSPPIPQKMIHWPLDGGQPFYCRGLFGASENKKYPFTNYEPSWYYTAMPSGKIVLHKKQKQFLTIRTFYGGGTFDVAIWCKLYYTDGTDSGSMAIIADGATVPSDTFVTANVGYTELGIDSIKASGKDVLKYDLKITFDEGVGETFTFFVEQNDQRNPRHFLFFNSYGFPETVYFHGNASRKIDFDTTIVQRDRLKVNQTFGIVEGQFDETNTELQRGFELSTGNKDKTHLDYYTDFIASPARFEQQTSQWMKVVMDKTTIDTDKDDDTLFALNFKFKYALKERGIA